MLIQDILDPKSSFEARNEPKDLTPDETKPEVKKEILGRKSKSVH